jgi:hypothetical protein
MYGQLPSYVKANATTYDLMVMDTVLSWEQQKSDEANGTKHIPKLTQEQMLKMMASVKEGVNDGG